MPLYCRFKLVPRGLSPRQLVFLLSDATLKKRFPNRWTWSGTCRDKCTHKNIPTLDGTLKKDEKFSGGIGKGTKKSYLLWKIVVFLL